MKNAGTVLSRAQIMEHIWTADGNPFSNTVEAHIRNLRLKLIKAEAAKAELSAVIDEAKVEGKV